MGKARCRVCMSNAVCMDDIEPWGKRPLIKDGLQYTGWRHEMKTFSALLLFVRGIHRSPVNSHHKGQWRGGLMFSLIYAWIHKGQWRGALMFSLICAGINGWVNNREAGNLRRHRAHYDVMVMRFRRLAAPWMPNDLAVLHNWVSGHWAKGACGDQCPAHIVESIKLS